MDAAPRPKHILVTTFWSFKDALVQTYTLPYLRMIHRNLPPGSTIYLLTIEQPRFQVQPDEWPGIRAALAQHGIELVSFAYQPYGLRSWLNWARIIGSLYWLVASRGIGHIHAFCTPGGLPGYLLAAFTGRPLIIDSYEPHAEASVENGDWPRDSFRFKFLFALERLMSHRAHTVIAAAAGMRAYAQEKYHAKFKRFYVKPACVDLSLFSEKDRKRPDLVQAMGYEDKLVCVYAGKFGGIYLDREVFDFLRVAHQYWGDRFRVLVLSSHSPAEVTALATASGLDPDIVQVQFVPHAQIAGYMGLADFALTPVKPIPTKRYCTPIKDGEYWALGLPVVITPNISDDSQIIEEEQIGAVVREFTEADYARVVREVDTLLQSSHRDELFQKIRAVAIRYRSLGLAERIYWEIYG
jgi:hypothetical protein